MVQGFGRLADRHAHRQAGGTVAPRAARPVGDVDPAPQRVDGVVVRRAPNVEGRLQRLGELRRPLRLDEGDEVLGAEPAGQPLGLHPGQLQEQIGQPPDQALAPGEAVVAGEGAQALDLGDDDGHRLAGLEAAAEVVVDLDAAEEPGGVAVGVGLVVEADPLDELGHLDRLHEVVVDAALEGGEPVGDVGPPRQHDDGGIPAEFAADAAADGGAAPPGHGGVDDHDPGLVQAHGRDRLVTVGGGDRPVSVEFEGDAEQTADGSVVVCGSLPGSVMRRSTAACTGIATAAAATTATAHTETRPGIVTT